MVVMVGLLTYEPNADGAWFFAEEVLPRLRAGRPGTQFRLIGRYDWQVEPLADSPASPCWARSTISMPSCGALTWR